MPRVCTPSPHLRARTAGQWLSYHAESAQIAQNVEKYPDNTPNSFQRAHACDDADLVLQPSCSRSLFKMRLNFLEPCNSTPVEFIIIARFRANIDIFVSAAFWHVEDDADGGSETGCRARRRGERGRTCGRYIPLMCIMLSRTPGQGEHMIECEHPSQSREADGWEQNVTRSSSCVGRRRLYYPAARDVTPPAANNS